MCVCVVCVCVCFFLQAEDGIRDLVRSRGLGDVYKRQDLDTTINTLAQTGRDMSAKYKETSEGGLAANLVLC